MRLSLRWKMLFLVLLLIVIPILSLSINDYSNSVDRLADNVREAARSTLAGTEDVTDLFLKSIEEAVTMVSKNVSVQNSIDDDGAAEKTVELFAAYLEAHEDALNVFMGTRNKDFLVYPLAELPPDLIPQHGPGILEP